MKNSLSRKQAAKFSMLFSSLLLILLHLNGCKQPGTVEQSKASSDPIISPVFSGDSAYAHVARQVAFGPRVVNTPAHQACGDYFISFLEKHCDTVHVQEGSARAWNGEILRFRNIIGVFNPSAVSRIFVAAHWDSRPYADHDPDPAYHRQPIDGANDGASGSGVILELARIMSMHPPNQGVDLILFDAEDYGEPQDTPREHVNNWGLGSQYWSIHAHVPGYRARYGVLLDMVGVPDPNFTWEGTSRFFAQDVLEMVWRKASQVGYAQHFKRDKTPPVVDDHYFVNEKAGFPTINIIHYDPNTPHGFFQHWHTMEDKLDHVDPKSLQMVGDVMIRVIYDPS